jgi:hypothetical protein
VANPDMVIWYSQGCGRHSACKGGSKDGERDECRVDIDDA